MNEQRPDMYKEISSRKSDPDWPREIASNVIARFHQESEKNKSILYLDRKWLAAAAVFLVGISIGWFTWNNIRHEEDSIREVSWIWEGDSYISVLESNF
ncbi:DUF3379 domain-containing protein [Leptospira fluminis]|nr:DUF3379 domain-containing protein [Leptospira fluminis]